MSRQTESYLILFVSFTTAFVGMAYELWLARFLSSMTQDYLLSQSWTIGSYLLALGIGAYTLSLFKIQNYAKQILKIELILALVANLSVFVILGLNLLSEAQLLPKIFLSQKGLVAGLQVVPILIGFICGMELPLLMKWMDKVSSQSFQLVLGTSYFGGLLASLLLSLFIIPTFGLISSLYVLALITTLAALIIYIHIYGLNFSRYLLPLIALLIAPVLAFHYTQAIEQFYLKSYYYYLPKDFDLYKNLPHIERYSTKFQEVDIVKDNPFDYRNNDYHLFLDHRNQFGSTNEVIYHETMVHVPIHFMLEIPKRVLILGGGDGGLTRELLHYKEIESIDLVELDEKMISLAKNHPLLSQVSAGSFKSSKVRVHIQDAFEWVRKNKQQKFDLILVDLPHPFSHDIARLYTYEFYQFATQLLNMDGLFVLDYPASALLKNRKRHPELAENLASIIQALKMAGLQSTIAVGSWESFLISSQKPKALIWNYNKLSSRISDQSVMNIDEIDLSPLENISPKPNSLFRPQILREIIDGL